VDKEIARLTVEEAYQSSKAKKITIPGLAAGNPQVGARMYDYQQPSNNGGFVSLDMLYPSLSEEEKAMTVEAFLKSRKPKNHVIWILAVLALIFMTLAILVILRLI